jgi:hypothetical protein
MVIKRSNVFLRGGTGTFQTIALTGPNPTHNTALHSLAWTSARRSAA